MSNRRMPASLWSIALVATAALIGLVTAPQAAYAQCGDPNFSTFPSHIVVCPRGDLPVTGTVASAGGPCAGSTIQMQFVGAAVTALTPSPGYPFPAALSTTNATGNVLFRAAIGGCAMAGSVAYYDNANGTLVGKTYTINSVDINGDGTVGLPDLSIFAAAFSGAYSRCADFNLDGVINLTDLSILAAHYGH